MSSKSSISTTNLNLPILIFLLLISPYLSTTFVSAARTLPLLRKSTPRIDDSLTFLWPLPAQYSFGNETLSVDPNLSLVLSGNGENSSIISEAFLRYQTIIFKHRPRASASGGIYDIQKLSIIIHSENEELQLGVDESYSLLVAKNDEHSIIGEATIEVYALID